MLRVWEFSSGLMEDSPSPSVWPYVSVPKLGLALSTVVGSY